MCLYSNFKEPQIAQEDIECYKLLRPYDEGKYETFYLGIRINPDVLNGKSPLVAKKLFCDGQISPNYDLIESVRLLKYKIRDGFIHTFLYKEDFEAIGFKNYSVFRCIIPKGTPYHTGMFPVKGNNYSALCSSEIIFKEKIQ